MGWVRLMWWLLIVMTLRTTWAGDWNKKDAERSPNNIEIDQATRDDIYNFLMKKYEEKLKNRDTSLKNDNTNDGSKFRRSIVDDKKFEVIDKSREKNNAVFSTIEKNLVNREQDFKMSKKNFNEKLQMDEIPLQDKKTNGFKKIRSRSDEQEEFGWQSKEIRKIRQNYLENLISSYLEKQDRRNHGRKMRRSLGATEEKSGIALNAKRLEKMMEKAILKIITGDLSTADMLLLKSFNYSFEEVMAIRERELGKKNEPKILNFQKISTDQEKDQQNLESIESLTEPLQANRLEIDSALSSTLAPISEKKKKAKKTKTPDQVFDFDTYNKQAVIDYENAANKMAQQSELETALSVSDYDYRTRDDHDDQDLRTTLNDTMEPHVIFKIRYDDSEFDSSSNEKARKLSKELGAISLPNTHSNFMIPWQVKKNTDQVASTNVDTSNGFNTTPGNHENKTFLESSGDLRSTLPIVYRLGNFVTPHEDPIRSTTDQEPNLTKNASLDSFESSGNAEIGNDNVSVDTMAKNESFGDDEKIREYAGLEWVEDDVYRVIPEAMDLLNYDLTQTDSDNGTIEDSEGNGTSSIDLDSRIDYDEKKNDTIGFQNENGEDIISNSSNLPNVSLSVYQQIALARRQDQGQKAIEDIKLKVLALTGRFNLSSNSNQVQRQRLTMFAPTCQVPKNTDPEAWVDPFSMNMYFELNLTSGDHVVAAKLRIFKLPQDNTNSSTAGATDAEDEEEKKIRISIYFYTKSLKKHRSKKRLMDSVVTALTPQGNHLALDVRQAIRFWRQHSEGSHSSANNHGLMIQVEDQEGKPLKPSLYLQQDSCHTSEQNEDDKAYHQRVPALFIQACSRYVRVVNGEVVTYVNCSKSSRNSRH